MTRRLNRSKKVPLKFIDTNYSNNSKMKNKKVLDMEAEIEKNNDSHDDVVDVADVADVANGCNDEFCENCDENGKIRDHVNTMGENLEGENLNVESENLEVTNSSKHGDEQDKTPKGWSEKSVPMNFAESVSNSDNSFKNVNSSINPADHVNTVNMSSYAKVVGNDSEIDKNLFYVPTGQNDSGDEVVIFEEDLVMEGRMNYVINQSPWMVKGKPLVVQKWDLSVSIEKIDPCKIPIWARLVNAPLEAWSLRGISTLASRLGKPIMMDSMTASMCHKGNGRPGYARVLVEIDAAKGLPDKIEIAYKDNSVCKSNKNGSMVEKKGMDNGITKEKVGNDEGFVTVRNRRNQEYGNNAVKNKNTGVFGKPKFQYRPIVKQKEVPVNNPKEIDKGEQKEKSANKYAVLAEEMEMVEYEKTLDQNEKLAVDWHVLRKQKPNVEESKKWSHDMLQYFKIRWQIVNKGDVDNDSDDDIIEDHMNENEGIIADEIEGGMNNEVKQNEVEKFIYEEKLQICALIETHLKQNSISRVGNKIFGQWDWVSNLLYSPTSCRIMLGWNPLLAKVMVISMSKQSIFCSVEVMQSKIKFYCTIVYASNNGNERRLLWNELLYQKHITGQWPWIVLGDFNVTMNASEHSSGGAHRTLDMQEFKDTMNALEVEDICSNGFHFTWTKSLKNPNCTILKKLDRILINEEFMQKFPTAFGTFLPYIISDHSPALLIIKDGRPKMKKAFRFSNFITRKEEFVDIVKKEWDVNIQGNQMFQFVKKLKRLKHPLNNLSWKKGNIFNNVILLKEKLKCCQENVDKNPHDKDMKKISVATLNDYNDAVKDEICLLKQKAKINRMKYGDKNSAYFHRILKSRRNKGRIERICDDHGIFFEGDQVPEQFVKHFENFLGKASPVTNLNNEIFTNSLYMEDVEDMVREVCDKEIKEALFDIDGDKASGPDGFSSEFFKKAWDIIGEDFCSAVKEFFSSGKLLGEINATLIALIPKINSPQKVSEFRPIACCNVMYKCISKVLTNRIKSGLEKIVHINQSAFIPGRHIQDNILIAQELLKGYNRRNGSKRCAMQIDIQKAYDTVNWNFMENVLIGFGFHRTMVNWIMQCISSSKFSICLNGNAHGYFKGGRGLRQGDPISPYLFTLVMEVFNLIMKKNIAASNGFEYHFGCKELKLSHICFADDLLVLCKGNKDSLMVIKQSIEEFGQVSGLTANLGKSIIFFGSIKEDEKQELLKILPFKCGKLPVKYLGVPLLAKKLSVQDCKVLIDKVEDKVNCWKNKSLSYAGRLQLIASVLSSMQIYWAQYISSLSKARIAWKLVCRPKEQGGLGIKPLSQWNEVLLIRQFWKILENKKSLWAEWVNIVKLKNRSVWNIQVEPNDSWGWKTMMNIRDKIKNHVMYEIGNGNTISVWYDRWNPIGPIGDFISQRELYDARLPISAKISDVISGNQWKWPSDWIDKFPLMHNIISPPSLIEKEDRVVWITNNGLKVKYSTMQAWLDMREDWPIVEWKNVVWFNQMIPKHWFILWLAIQKKLLTQDRIEKWNKGGVMLCGFCNTIRDSHEHLFFQCDFANKVWKEVVKLSYKASPQMQLEDLCDDLGKRNMGSKFGNVVDKLMLAATVYYIWQERNTRIFKAEKRNVEVICNLIKDCEKQDHEPKCQEN
ncbi:RNA-directed DNA polymerase, eukaryota, reverse transcriptase zinc-binding domain protein [Tanacetum coccineum]